ncbi:MAG: hypothetical protein AB8B99_04505 [Phormidesmis sp.]
MTYTDHIHTDHIHTDRINNLKEVEEPTTTSETTEKLTLLQQEGTKRAKRIAQILRAAFSETAAEFQAGRTVLSPLAKEVTAETVAATKENSQRISETINQIWQDTDNEDKTERIIQFVRTLASTAKNKLFPQLKRQAGKLDSTLSSQYGERYTNLKEHFEVVRTWYIVPEQEASTTTVETASGEAPTIEVTSEVIQ